MNRRSVVNAPPGGGGKGFGAQQGQVYDFGETDRSGPAKEGWDKYYFFSDPICKTVVHKTARMGRNRPAALGPQTFLMQSSFSEQTLSRVKEGKEPTTYAESFSQLARTKRALSREELPPLSPTRSLIGVYVPGSPNKRMKEEEVERKLAEQQAEAEAKAKTRGPPGLGGGISKKLEKPPMPSNATMSPHIFPNGHVTSDQLFAQDRKAPRNFSYTGGMSMAFR